ncbi:MAG: SHOCT domain-containing protein [Solirubrobacterales bacterium]
MSEMERIDALRKLGELHDSGVLTDDEFDAEKEKLI